MLINKYLKVVGCTLLTCLLFLSVHSQDTTLLKYSKVKEQYIASVNSKVESFNKDVENYTDKALERVIRQEKKMQKKVAKVDSVKAKLLFKYSIDSLKKFQTLIKAKTGRISKYFRGNYFPYLDTLKQSLSFINKAKGIKDSIGNMQGRLNASINSVDQMQAKLATVDQINEYMKQRETVLQSQLRTFPGIADNLGKINKEFVYYQAQIEEYKNTLNDPEKIEKIALGILRKMPAFQKFVQQNSQLAGIFPSSSSSLSGDGSASVINGLPSRLAVQQFAQKEMPSYTTPDVTQAVQQKVEGAQSALSNLKEKLNSLGGKGDVSMPDFSPNSQHTKSVSKRLEFGANMQFGNSTGNMPASSNFGLQAGYKLNDKSSIGIGLSYTMGLGTGWNHIRFSNEALGMRTYLKWKPKGTFFLQGGGEWNYMTQFSSIAELKKFNAWQTSMLLGLGKDYKVSKKLSGSVQFLYDFLYEQHVPVTRPFMFRIGYNF